MNNKYNLIYLDSVSSTNLFLKERYKEYEEFTLVYTNNQLSGKGRLGREWKSNNDSIALSVLLKPNNLDNISNISLVAGAAVFETLKKYVKVSIKWPNDILVNDKKVCGILLEAISTDKIEALVVGVGINVNNQCFDESIKNKASSLKIELGTDFDKDEIINNFINNFDYLYNDFLNNGNLYLDIVKNNFYLKNKKAYINNKFIEVIDLDNDGSLIVLEDNKYKKIYSGEVTLENFYN
jgi:BirA family biotin operon repressor/biotin-[acetyl-CoA-carboxylase] ligase